MEWLMRQRQRWYIPHNYSAIQQFHRNFDLAAFTGRPSGSFCRDPIGRRGIRLVKNRRMALQTGKTMAGDPAGMAERLEISGLSSGKEIQKLPKWVIPRCTMNPKYWE